MSAVFETNLAANQAIENLLHEGVPSDRISALMSRETRQRYYPEGNKAGEGAGWGAGVGTVVGGLAALASLTVPGGIFVAGPFAAFLGGAAVGAAGGGLVGALIGLDIPKDRAGVYEDHINKGGIVVAAETHTAEEAARAEEALLRAGGPLPRETLVVTGQEARI
ncbi:MAG: hypothetical protein ACOC1F_07245 [Myxococcota bacterium]